MTNYIILALCLIVIIAYIFDITSRYTKIPGVGMLILLGIGIQLLVANTGFSIPNMKPLLPVLGTIGLILIVMEASLDIKLERNKIRLIIKSVSSAIFLFVFFVAILSFIMVNILGYKLIDSLLNAIPLGIISSAVAITSSVHLDPEQKEFIIYESSFSDIIGILVFDFIIINQNSIGWGLVNFAFSGILTIFLSAAITSVLALLLHKISYHINYIIIMTSVVMVYALAKIIHLPALFLVLVFGIALSNSHLVEHTIIKRYVDFEKFRNDLESFRRILRELTFIVRSFFFVMFGYYASIGGLFSLNNILVSLVITAGMLLIRWLFVRYVLKIPSLTLVFFAPRGLITILLFLSIPEISKITLINEEVVTLVILMTIIVMMGSNILYKRKLETPPIFEESVESQPDMESDLETKNVS
ncbi:MAG TPA: cation:proton antiporter [Bacteroidales bacterium]|nr:cation:proton antiporter [Bacteroidales bacterium]